MQLTWPDLFYTIWRQARTCLFAILSSLLLVLSCPEKADATGSLDITTSFEFIHTPWGSVTADELFAGNQTEKFQSLVPPTNISQFGKETWLRATLPATAPMAVLEIPGQIFNFVDVWFRLPDGDIEHYYAGDKYPYVDRAIPHASSAFPIPSSTLGPIDVLIRARNETTHRMNFAAWIWPEADWQSYLLNQRAWYGAFLGAMTVLCIYNLFLAVTLRDSSYLFYVGYILCLSVCIVLLNGLAEEYIWPQGKPAHFVLFFSGLGAFLAVGFVNQFLRIRASNPGVYWCSTLIAALAVLCGCILIFTNQLPFVPGPHSVTVVHVLILAAGVYFICVSLVSYLAGITQARFLALSMLALLSSAIIYFTYTYGFLRYNVYIGHALEVGGLAEGVLLSLALADRITILTRQKQAAERAAVEYQISFSRQLISAQEKERQAISESLHDSIGHAVLVLRNNLLRSAASNPDQESQQDILLREQADRCSEIMNDVRRLSHDLHPHMLERLGLAEALNSTMERAFGSTGINYTITIDKLPDKLLPELEITVYRVIQECLNNILKHAEATAVSLDIAAQEGEVHCTLFDNGVGFSAAATGDTTLGLREMAGRVELLGGRFRTQSSAGKGTTIEFVLPIDPRESLVQPTGGVFT
ncbi:MAG: 7TM diverse intracellular signaling domain-containing protein [Halioglobus sp.]